MVKCKILVQNRDILKNEFQWASTNMIPLCAYYFAEQGKRVDAVRMKECKQLMKKSAGVFTRVKGDDLYPFAAMLALQKNVNKALEERMQVYQTLEMHYQPSVWLTMAAFLLAEKQEEKEICIEETITRALHLEEKVKEQKEVREEDRILYLLLALSEKEESTLSGNLETYYEQLQKRNLSEEVIPALAAILTLADSQPDETVHRLDEAVQEVNKYQLRMGEGVESIALGMIAAANKGEITSYVEDASKLNEYLKGQKGFDSIYLAANQRLTYAILLATANDAPSISQQITMVSVLNSVLSLTVLE